MSPMIPDRLPAHLVGGTPIPDTTCSGGWLERAAGHRNRNRPSLLRIRLSMGSVKAPNHGLLRQVHGVAPTPPNSGHLLCESQQSPNGGST